MLDVVLRGSFPLLLGIMVAVRLKARAATALACFLVMASSAAGRREGDLEETNLEPRGAESSFIQDGGDSTLELHLASHGQAFTFEGHTADSALRFHSQGHAVTVQDHRGNSTVQFVQQQHTAVMEDHGENSNTHLALLRRAMAAQARFKSSGVAAPAAKAMGGGNASLAAEPIDFVHPHTCWQDVPGGDRLGCRVDLCECSWFESCFPKFAKHAAAEGEEPRRRDVGVCNPSMTVLVVTSLAIFGQTLACIIVLRVFCQWRERIQSLVEGNLEQKQTYQSEEEEDEGAKSSDQDDAAADPRSRPDAGAPEDAIGGEQIAAGPAVESSFTFRPVLGSYKASVGSGSAPVFTG